MELTVRTARESDWADVRDLRLQALTEVPLSFGSTLARELQLGEEEWRARASRTGHVLAWAGGILVGCAVGIVEGGVVEGGVEEAGDLHLTGMYVTPNHRGTGCADRLIEAVLEDARLTGAGRVVLWVTEVNPRAERCYTRHGFRRTGRQQPLPHTLYVTEQEMELRLR